VALRIVDDQFELAGLEIRRCIHRVVGRCLNIQGQADGALAI